MSLSTLYPTSRPSLLLDFVNRRRLDSRITFTRASSATYFNANGVLQTAGNDVARFDFDPATLAPRGLLIEEQRTNSIRNNTMVGAVAGTPGTAPTNWALTAAGGNITSREIVAIGAENGIAYIDVRYVFSGAATANVRHEVVGQIAANNTQTWTAAAYVRLVGGTTTNVTTNVVVTQYDSGFIALETTNAAFTPQATGLGTSRPTVTKATNQATVASVTSAISIVASGAADITLRIGLPQLEQGAFATSVIPTTTTALTRSMDVASMTGANFSSWYNATEGTILSEALISGYTVPAANFPLIASLNDGTGNNCIENGYVTATLSSFVVRSGNVEQAGLYPSAGSVQQRRVASAYRLNDFAVSANGGTVQTDTSGTVPTVDRLRLGERLATSGTSVICLNGHIRRIAYYPSRLTNAQLQALTAS